MAPKAAAKTAERHLPAIKNELMLGEQDAAVLSTKCRVQDVRFGGPDEDGVTETFVRIKTQLPSANMPHFIMRKAADDYISATSMFRAVFYQATSKQEKVEMEVVKKELAARSDTNASGVWIPGTPDALQLADTYGIRPWVQALLDAPTSKSAYPQEDRRASSNAVVSPRQPSSDQASPPVAATPSRRTTRERSQSPKKAAASTRKVKKAAKETVETIKEDINGIKDSVENNMPTAQSAKIKIADLLDTVTGDSQTPTKTSDDDAKYTATVSSEGQSMADMVKEARAQVEEAQRKDKESLSKSGLSTSKTSSAKTKKRALEKDDDEQIKDQIVSVKRGRVDDLEVQILKEQRKVRALFGLVIGLGATAILPYIL